MNRPPHDAAAALGRYADHMVGSRDAPPMLDPMLDPELAAVVRRLGALGQRPAPLGARERVWSRIQSPASSNLTVRVEVQEGSEMNAIPITMPMPPRARRRASSAPPWSAYPLVALIALGMALAAYAGFTRWTGDGPERVVPAAQVATPTAEQRAADEPTASVQFNAAPQVAGCVTAPREPGRVEALFETERMTTIGLLPRPSNDVIHAAALLDGEAYIERYTSGSADDETIASINETLAQLDACRYHAVLSSGERDFDGPYYANFSDNFFSLLFASRASDGDARDNWPQWIPKQGVVPVVQQAWLTTDGRVLATVLGGFEFEPNVRTAMVFSQQDGRWLVEEIARTMVFDSPPALPERAEVTVEILDLVMYDADAPRAPGADGNYSLIGAYAPDYPFIADGGLLIRLVNLGSLPHTFTIPSLDIARTLEPGEVVDLPIDAPVGTYDWAIYEGLDPEPTATHKLQLVAPGTLRGKG